MKDGIHPSYEVTTYQCSCGNKFESMSTKGGNLHVELCDKCHPFYTGQQKLIDTGGRVQRFADKFGNAAAATLEKDAAAQEARRQAAEEAEEVRRLAREKREAEKAARAAEHRSVSDKIEQAVEDIIDREDEKALIVDEQTKERDAAEDAQEAQDKLAAEIAGADEVNVEEVVVTCEAAPSADVDDAADSAEAEAVVAEEIEDAS